MRPALGDDSAFQRFQSLARRLFAVPKREIDEKLAEYHKQRKGKRGPAAKRGRRK